MKSRCFLFIFIILVFILDFRLVRKLVFLYFNVNVYLKEIPCLNKVTLPYRMNVSKVFSKLDRKWEYHQLELSPESREITTFATPDGLFRYKRLLFGVCSASEQYQHEIASALTGIEGVENISDDIVVHGPDTETHNRRLH